MEIPHVFKANGGIIKVDGKDRPTCRHCGGINIAPQHDLKADRR